jgi:hypothetical protein
LVDPGLPMEIGKSAFSTGLEGLNKSLNGMQKAAHDIASFNVKEDVGGVEGLTEALIDLKKHELSAKASIEVIKVANEVAGSIIDIKV